METLKDQIQNANPEGKTLLKFGLLLSKLPEQNLYYGDNVIQRIWEEFFQKFMLQFEEMLKKNMKSYQEKEWYKSLTKIYRSYQEKETSYRTFDYYCLKEKLCIVCKKDLIALILMKN